MHLSEGNPSGPRPGPVDYAGELVGPFHHRAELLPSIPDAAQQPLHFRPSIRKRISSCERPSNSSMRGSLCMGEGTVADNHGGVRLPQ